MIEVDFHSDWDSNEGGEAVQGGAGDLSKPRKAEGVTCDGVQYVPVRH